MRLKLPSKLSQPADDAGSSVGRIPTYLDSEYRMDSEWAVGWTLCAQASGILGVLWAYKKERGLFLFSQNVEVITHERE